MTYKRIKNDIGSVAEYICNENPDIVIKLEYGSLSHDRPSGFTLYHKDVLCSTWMTLKEAKAEAEDIKA